MRQIILKFLLVLFLSGYAFNAYSNRDKIDLAGEWDYILTLAPAEIPAEGTLTLPGTLDTNGVGIPVPVSDDTSQLSRRVTYTGPAIYSRRIVIPQEWEGKAITLLLERTRPSTVRVDGNEAGSSSLISAPQRYDLSDLLTPGVHTLEIEVDNGESIPLTVRNNSHACTESTQTNWNGIIGKIELSAAEPLNIASAISFPQINDNLRRYEVTLSDLPPVGSAIKISDAHGKSIMEKFPEDYVSAEFSVPLNWDEKMWSEWTPATGKVKIELISPSGETTDGVEIETGVRDFHVEGNFMKINGHPVFLRGKHDACVFPLTAHVPMDYKTWKRYFDILKSYGINHVRFHSWCPPEACFKAADDTGVYLQPELPIWGELSKDNPKLIEFLTNELDAIITEYSSHPSFTMFALGNELWGNTDFMKTFIDRARDLNPDILMTYGSNVYLGWKGHIDGEDFLVTCRVGEGEGFTTHARASFSFADAENGGILNSTYPNSSNNFSDAIALSPVPVIGHETGQYQVYPDFNEIIKYSGVLRPDNLQEFARRATEAGNLSKTHKFFKASGEWASRLYKADMEMNLRTPDMGGFQLLDIQDYPGQGTALVGILDAFMDSKGLISEEEWRQSCAPVTILAEFPKFCFTSGETVRIPVKMANFSGRDLNGMEIKWEVPFKQGSLMAQEGEGLVRAGEVVLQMPELSTPQKMVFTLSSPEADNSYDLWIYPRSADVEKDVFVTTSLDDALQSLSRGESVILCPDTALVSATTLGPLFTTDYWNYRMFRSICDKMGMTPSPGTLGLLIDNRHDAFNSFPTDFHTDWQWYPIISNSRPLIIDRLPKEVNPIVEVIDNVERNYRLSLMMECAVGKGKLLILSVDMNKAQEHPEGQWLMKSVKDYVASKQFKPDLTLTEQQLKNLLTRPSAKRVIKELRNESYEGMNI